MNNINIRKLVDPNSGEQFYPQTDINGLVNNGGSGVDDEPTDGSDNLVKSGGVQNELALGAVYDVSAKNPTSGPNNDGKFESLSALLSDANLNTLIPVAVRKGGMSIKFVQTSDNKYVQYRLMLSEFTAAQFANTANWQGVDENPTANSKNLAESGGIYSFARNYKGTLAASTDNIDNIHDDSTYTINTTYVSGTLPNGISTYASLTTFGDGRFSYQILTEILTNYHSWIRTSYDNSYTGWKEITWNNLFNGLLTAESNIDSLSKSGHYIIPLNKTPQGTLPTNYNNTKVGDLFHMNGGNTGGVYAQILIQDTVSWIRNYAGSWIKITTPDLVQTITDNRNTIPSSHAVFAYAKDFKATLTANDNIDNIRAEGSYLVNTTTTQGTYPSVVPTYCILKQFGSGNYWVQMLSKTTRRADATTWIRTTGHASGGVQTWNTWTQITNLPVPEPVDPSQPLYGKKMVFFGDSVTEGNAAGAQGQINNYPQFVATRTGATIVNVGIGGTQMANHVAAPDYNPFSFCNIVTAITTNTWTTQDEKASVIGKTAQLADMKALDLSTYDYVVIAYGQNDRSNGVQVGNSDSTNNDEFYGALNNSINALLTAYPNLHIIYVAPYNRVSAPASNPMLPFVNAILDVAEKWAMPAINLYKISGINAKTVGTYLEDGLHPKLNSKYGYEFLGNVIGAQILSVV